ncbi:hypothetical protein [Rhodovulum sp. P5]|uniref:hypothetical protein n=1 Tax=Rhodovulum sp. P5 TaxID=1564506 RepID=UPI0012EC9F8F|nr:hypothetical protein [Rhodovulum sp. P5]
MNSFRRSIVFAGIGSVTLAAVMLVYFSFYADAENHLLLVRVLYAIAVGLITFVAAWSLPVIKNIFGF